MKTKLVSLFLSVAFACGASAKDYCLQSPDGTLTVTVSDEGQLTWSVSQDGLPVLLPSVLALETSAGHFGVSPSVTASRESRVDSRFATPFYKRSEVRDRYNQLVLTCKGGYSVEFRAYDDGVAYRFATTKKRLTVKNETAHFCFAADYDAWVPYVNDNRGGERWCYSFESYYDEQPLSAMFADSLAITPLAVGLPGGKKAVVMDAGVEDYPGMMLVRGRAGSHTLEARFAPFPSDVEIGGYARLNLVPTRRADFIAQTREARSFPWRVVLVSRTDADLLDTDMAQRLAPPCRLKDTSWVKPGKVAWDWWNNLNLTGVDFEAGMNTDTYKYFIDFAQRNHLEYIIIDEGWSSPESLMQLSDKIDLSQLISYADQRGVGIILWSSWRNLIGHTDSAEDNQAPAASRLAARRTDRRADPREAAADAVFAHYAAMGIKGFKVDFFDRDDQEVISSAYSLAELAARHHLLLDLHGLKPMGIQRAWPNVVNFEGVKGLENSKWEPRAGDGPLHDQPRYDVTAPFLRMLPGPMDYTPGAMSNATRDQFFGNNDHPMSQGTRVHQMAMYTVFEAPLQMLADSPTAYERWPECLAFIREVPTTWDETVVLDAAMGQYVVLARRKGATWFVAAMTNWTARDLTIDLNRLPGLGTEAVAFSDGRNAHREATDYRRTETTLAPGQKLTVHLAPGGGWTARIR